MAKFRSIVAGGCYHAPKNVAKKTVFPLLYDLTVVFETHLAKTLSLNIGTFRLWTLRAGPLVGGSEKRQRSSPLPVQPVRNIFRSIGTFFLRKSRIRSGCCRCRLVCKERTTVIISIVCRWVVFIVSNQERASHTSVEVYSPKRRKGPTNNSTYSVGEG